MYIECSHKPFVTGAISRKKIFYMADIWVIHEQVSDSIEAMEFQKSPKTCLQGTSIKYM